MKENTGMESDDEAPYIQDRTGDAAKDALSIIDEDRLREVAARLGVPYVHRSAGDPVSAMVQEARAGALERMEQDGSLAGRIEFYWLFAAGAFVVGLAELMGFIRQLREVRPAARPLRAAHGGQPKEMAG